MMTNNEALQAVLSPISYESIVADKAMLDHDLIGTALYTKDLSGSIDQVALSVLEWLLSAPDVSEGGLSIKYNREAITQRMEMITNRLGLSGTVMGPTIQSRTNLW